MDLDQALLRVQELEDIVKEKEQSVAALSSKKEEILSEKKNLQSKMEADYVLRTQVTQNNEDKFSRLETQLTQLQNKYEEDTRKHQEKEKHFKEQNIVSSIVSSFGDVCHNPEEFANLLKYQGLATTNDSGVPVVLFEGKEMSPSEFKVCAMENKKWQHHFKPTAGAGTGKSFGNTSSLNTKNPWNKETLNVTEQFKLLKSKPSLAQKLRKEAQ